MAVPRPTLGHSQADSLTNPMLITAFVQVRPEGHREPRNEVGCLCPAKRRVCFEPGAFRFWPQHLNTLGHCPQIGVRSLYKINICFFVLQVTFKTAVPTRQYKFTLTFSALNPQNGKTHSNNSSAICRRIVWVCLTILWGWRLKG